MLLINGEKKDAVGLTVSQYLAAENTPPQHIAIMINEVILSKEDFDSTVFADGDTVEIIGFVGGGAFKN